MKHLRLAAAPLAAVMLTMVMAPNAFATTHLSGGTINSNTTWTTAAVLTCSMARRRSLQG